MADEPIGHEAAIAATDYTHALLVYVTTLEQSIYPVHDVQRILLTPGSTHGKGKLVAIATTAARVGVEDSVALSHKHLHLMEEAVAVLRLWSTVNLQYQGILFRWVEVMRLHDPAINRPPIFPLEGHIFRHCQCQFIKESIVETSDAPQVTRLVGGADEDFLGARWIAQEQG
jgi:hypothetical protein